MANGKNLLCSIILVAIGVLPDVSIAQDDDNVQQNAILEGIQISAEKGDKEFETNVTCFFIFLDKPSSYFYEVKRKPKRLIFEFTDTKKGTAPIPQVQEPPIIGFELEEAREDIYKDIKGYRPEWHDILRVVFKLNEIPKVSINDEYNVITFNYKWSNDPAKIKEYVVADNTLKIFLLSGGSLTAIGSGILAYWIYKVKSDAEKERPEITIGDIPLRPDNPTSP